MVSGGRVGRIALDAGQRARTRMVAEAPSPGQTPTRYGVGVRLTGASLLIIAGLLAYVGSAADWATCSTIGCQGVLQAFDESSGLDVGFGFVTGIAGAYLIVLGLIVRRGAGRVRTRPIATVLGVVIVVTVTLYVTGVYVLRDLWYDAGVDPWLNAHGWPGLGAILSGIGGLLAIGAARRAAPAGDA